MTAGLSAVLTVVLLATPAFVFWLFDVDGGDTADFIARRAAMLFLGLAVMTFCSKDIGRSVGRRAIAAGIAAAMGGFAVLGTVEFARGFAGPGILLAVGAETALAAGYVVSWWSDRRALPVDEIDRR